MKITYKRTKGEHIVVVNNCVHTFGSSKDAWAFIFDIRKEVA